MKQWITMEQWDEVDHESKYIFLQTCGLSSSLQRSFSPVIGQMVDFLYHHMDLVIVSDAREGETMGWTINSKWMGKELVDALWLATKHTLKELRRN
jgi:hypothetical protein